MEGYEASDHLHIARGLEGVIAAATRIAEVDGERGKLTLCGYDIHELVGNIDFEEAAYLLWHGKLPDEKEYKTMRREMSDARKLPEVALEALRIISPHTSGMHLLRMGAAMLSLDDPDIDNLDIDASRKRAARLTAKLPALIAHSWRLHNGDDIIEPKPEQGLAEGFLYMLEGREPEKARVDGLNAYLVAVSEHGMPASSFTGRVIISTNSDMVSALTGAICALKGNKHGGVPGPVLDMLEAIGTVDKVEDYIRQEMADGRRIMGFGHRIYRVRDPRAEVLSEAAEKLAKIKNDSRLLELIKGVEDTTVRILAELKPGRDLYANVELYAALILHEVGIPPDLFTPTFAIGRTAGWTAHLLEQLEDNRLIRPNSLYIGPRHQEWEPIESRS